MNKNTLKPNSAAGTQNLTQLLERFDRLISEGEMILQDAKNMDFCCEESIWDAWGFHIEEVEVIRNRWNQEVLYFLEDEFGSDSAIYGDLRQNLQVTCYSLYDEIEDTEDCLAALCVERQNLITRMPSEA
jgi:hypothetical protein